MQTISTDQMKRTVSQVALRFGYSLMFWGTFGIGKSQIMRQIAIALYNEWAERNDHELFCDDGHNNPRNLVDVRLNQYDSVDMRGVPGIDRESNVTKWYVPAVIPFEANPAFDDLGDCPIILFLDELTSAPLAVQTVAFQLTNDRAAGEHKLQSNVIVLAAGNLDTDQGVVHKMAKPLCNRLIHYKVEHDVDGWADWAAGAGLPPLGIAFFKAYPSYLHSYDPTKDEKAICTPRTAEKMLRIWAAKDVDEDIKRVTLCGTVGNQIAMDFLAFVDNYRKLPKLKDIVKDPKGVEVPAASDMRYAVCIMVGDALAKYHQHVEVLDDYLDRFPGSYHLTAWKHATAKNTLLFNHDRYVSVCKKHGAMMGVV